MAKKSSRSKAPGTRKRRNPEEIIADLQKQIREVKARAQAKETLKSPAVRSAKAAIKAIDRCLVLAEGEENSPLRHALADARKPLSAHLESLGVKLPKARMPKGPRPRQAK